MSKQNKQLAQEHKEKGNKFFASGQYSESLTWYIKAIQADPTDHVLHSNRSAAYPRDGDRERGEGKEERGQERGSDERARMRMRKRRSRKGKK